jgi:hypothetical protein
VNKNKLKSYAPAARRDFIQAVTDRAHFFGLSEKQIIPVEESGDVAIIGGRPFPRSVAAQRRKLEERVKREGFNQVMEAIAYTWFNRFLALRYMELHGYLEHGFRVLSNTGSSAIPEILDHAAQLELPGLNKQNVVELKLDGSKDAELYRLLLVAQCNALHTAMPFLFERIEDDTELLLPDNLLHSDSLIRKLVTEIEEEDWQEVEIIGWLYQFYISEKKDQVIGKVVKSEDIPAATQLFTPNWIVKYMVQNSLGRQWLATYPDSPLKAKMEYYIEPAEQTAEVKAQLAAITPDSLDPEKLTLLDPASGSGHILVEAYDVLKEIYLERGYSSRDFPRLILEKNLFGLDIDDRAAQMAGFALLMKARKDDRRILRSDNPVKLNVMAIQQSGNIVVDNAHWGTQANAIRDLVDLFRQGKTFGSLIPVPERLEAKLTAIENAVKKAMIGGDLYASQAAREMLALVEQSKILMRKYDCVVANPPYMGNKGMNSALKEMAQDKFPNTKSDLFSIFIEKIIDYTQCGGRCGIMSPFVWMFLKSYEELRRKLLFSQTLTSLVQPEYHSFFESAYVPLCAFIFQSIPSNYCGNYFDLTSFYGADEQPVRLLEAIKSNEIKYKHLMCQLDFQNVPSYAISYKMSRNTLSVFKEARILGEFASPKQGLATGENNQFLRNWSELSLGRVKFDAISRSDALKSNAKWFPYNKGGAYRKWYGNHDWVVNWEKDGEEIRRFGTEDGGRPRSRAQNTDYYFQKSLSWSKVTIGGFSVRYFPPGFVFDVAGCSIFELTPEIIPFLACALNSVITKPLLSDLAQTLNYEVGQIESFPVLRTWETMKSDNIRIFQSCVNIAEQDWNYYETSWHFVTIPVFYLNVKASSLDDSWSNWKVFCNAQVTRMHELETENNRLFIEAYGLQNELTAEVPEDQITLARADREADMKRLISYAIGCMMGRYSLEQPGVVYANSGDVDFDQSKYQAFPADDDGIVPVMDMDWFPDDAASRFEEFLKVAWSPATLEENLKFVADSLLPKNGETPRETIRRYISTQFLKDHLQTYKKRPIYWLFSSGKQRAFECLVYLHRYNESTLSRMRNEYVTPLQGKFSAQADYLVNEVNAATSTTERNRMQRQLDTLRKKQVELAAFDDLLRHYADQRISLDLDDGVKVNYGKFGNLLAEVKAVTGGQE